ncbi:hypothetical protein F2Q69_00035522 [Brassica cretica]|uniref:Uncharacterized protein n=1 Tax=Brassica cretica TaxID=69181 RepID=A0A8S9SUH1_BRACR|nr:hypothetical protein F2Q69_00035522 [Brassica cretica]
MQFSFFQSVNLHSAGINRIEYASLLLQKSKAGRCTRRGVAAEKRASKDGNRSNPAFHLKSGRASKTVLTRLWEAERQEIWRTHGVWLALS